MSQNTAASYTRVSTDDQHSIMAQLERIRKFAEGNGSNWSRSSRTKNTAEPRTTGQGSSG